MLDLSAFLGLMVNFSKSNLEPKRDFVFLGIQFQTEPFIYCPSRDRWLRLQALIHLFRKESSPTDRQGMRFIGTLTSMDSPSSAR